MKIVKLILFCFFINLFFVKICLGETFHLPVYITNKTNSFLKYHVNTVRFSFIFKGEKVGHNVRLMQGQKKIYVDIEKNILSNKIHMAQYIILYTSNIRTKAINCNIIYHNKNPQIKALHVLIASDHVCSVEVN